MRTYKRLSVNATDRTEKALALAMELTGDTQTDTVNRAIQLYAYIMFETKQQGAELILKDADGKHSFMKFM